MLIQLLPGKTKYPGNGTDTDKWCCLGVLLGSVLFSIVINNTDEGIKCTLSKFADDTKLRGAVCIPAGWDAIQRGLDKLQNWGHGNFRRFNKTRCKVLHVDQGNSQYDLRLGIKDLDTY